MAGSQRAAPHRVGPGCRPAALHHPGQLGPGLQRPGRLGLPVRGAEPDRRRRLLHTAQPGGQATRSMNEAILAANFSVPNNKT